MRLGECADWAVQNLGFCIVIALAHIVSSYSTLSGGISSACENDECILEGCRVISRGSRPQGRYPRNRNRKLLLSDPGGVAARGIYDPAGVEQPSLEPSRPGVSAPRASTPG